MLTNSDSKPAPLWLKLLPLAAFLLVWQITADHIERGTFFYGSPSTVMRALYDQARSGVLWINTGYTIGAVLLGFVLGNLSGIIAGLALAISRRGAQVFRPYLTVLGAVPIIAFAPIITILFGIGFLPKVLLAAFSTFVIAASQTFDGAMQTTPSSIALLESLGASRFTVFCKIVTPSSLVWFFSGLRLNVGVAILAVFIGEFITAKAGVGYQIMVDMGLFKTPAVLAGVVVISILSLLLTGAVGWVQNRFSYLRRLE
jgi:NitT/TauT family transport system permease protein